MVKWLTDTLAQDLRTEAALRATVAHLLDTVLATGGASLGLTTVMFVLDRWRACRQDISMHGIAARDWVQHASLRFARVAALGLLLADCEVQLAQTVAEVSTSQYAG